MKWNVLVMINKTSNNWLKLLPAVAGILLLLGPLAMYYI